MINSDGSYPRVIYESATSTEISVQEVATAVLDLKKAMPAGTIFDTVPEIGVVLPDGEFPALIGTEGPDRLDASTLSQSVEIYAGKGTDALYGGKGNDHHVPDEGDDLMVDPAGYDYYYLPLNPGQSFESFTMTISLENYG